MDKNIIWYVNEFGDKSFSEKELNEVDILIFSQLIYNDYHKVLKTFNDSFVFKDKIDELVSNNPLGFGSSRDIGSTILPYFKNKKRYENIIFKHYEYVKGKDYQFGAISIDVPNVGLFIAFEGTDATIPGWKEDFSLSYVYPTRSQYLAGKYINMVLSKNKCRVIVLGHSKGGNLALTGAMNTSPLKKMLIDKVYSFDGPGLRDKEFSSIKYKEIRDKVINIIPEQSLFGVLLNKENLIVIKSNTNGIMQHSALTWKLESDKITRGSQSMLSSNLQVALKNWLDKYNEKEKKEIINNIFLLFEENGIESFPQLGANKLKIINIIKTTLGFSKETKLLLINCIQVLIGEIGSQTYDDSKNKLIDMINDTKKSILSESR